MTRQQGNYVDVNHLRQGAPVNNTFAETIPRVLAGNDGAIAATGVVLSTAVALQAGDVVSNVTFITGGTGAGSPTAGFAALYSSASTPALLAQTAVVDPCAPGGCRRCEAPPVQVTVASTTLRPSGRFRHHPASEGPFPTAREGARSCLTSEV
jgi:hypothetical protein